MKLLDQVTEPEGRLAVEQALPGFRFTAARWYSIPNLAVGAATVANNTLRCHPFYLGADTTFDRIGVEYTVAAAPTTAVGRLGIYTDDGTGYPGAVLLDAGTVTFNATLTGKVITISQALGRGTLYWLALQITGATTTPPTLRVLSGSQQAAYVGLADESSPNGSHYSTTVAGAAALPATFPAGATNTNGARIMLRAA